MNSTLELTPERASLFAGLALRGIRTEFPNKLDHVITGPQYVLGPRALHPAFYGCFDWHSAVHSHWMLVRLLHTMPGLPEEGEIRAALGEHFSEARLEGEAAYLRGPGTRSFERTYGWAWLLKLAEELGAWDDPGGQEWSRNMRPLEEAFVERYLEFLPKQTYPIRTGTHPNTAFGLTFALDYARAVGHSELEQLVVERSRVYYLHDEDAPARWEPAGNDFFSPSLIEADLMRRVLPGEEFARWFGRFLPGVEARTPESLFTPAHVSDRTDPQIVHLDGLNLTRAWCMLGIASSLPQGSPSARVLRESAGEHRAAALPHIASGDYMGEHWLASFAVYLLTLSGAQSGAAAHP